MINVAIIGTGNIAPSHVQGYLHFPEEVTIKALCDIYPEKAEKMAERFDLDVDISDNHEAMLYRENRQLV